MSEDQPKGGSVFPLGPIVDALILERFEEGLLVHFWENSSR